jgi:hypothetical protein
MLNPFESKQERPGDYVVTRGSDTPEERADAAAILTANGCRRVRFESLEDGRVIAHGYLRAA